MLQTGQAEKAVVCYNLLISYVRVFAGMFTQTMKNRSGEQKLFFSHFFMSGDVFYFKNIEKINTLIKDNIIR